MHIDNYIYLYRLLFDVLTAFSAILVYFITSI
nr:MAG TPA: hypothetical protein [Caudoviricetes sp.]